MKKFLLFTFFLLAAVTTKAQFTGIEFIYNNAVYRIDNQYARTATLERSAGENLESIVIPGYADYADMKFRVIKIKEDCFKGMNSLRTLTFDLGDASDLRIEKNAFQGTNIESLEIPEGVIEIGESAFEGVPLKSLTFLGSSKKGLIIGSKAFANTLIEKIEIPAGVTEIGESAFEGCAAKSVSILDNSTLTSIGNRAFADTKNLQDIYITEDLNVDLYPVNELFAGCGIRSIEISGVYRGNAMFKDCTNLEELTFKDNQVISLGSDMFKNTRLSKIVFQASNQYDFFTGTFGSIPTLKEVYMAEEIFFGITTWQIHEEWGPFYKSNEDAVLYLVPELYNDNHYREWYPCIGFREVREWNGGAGVESAAVSNDVAEYYDLNGRRVMNPEKGIYLKRQGTEVTKTVIR